MIKSAIVGIKNENNKLCQDFIFAFCLYVSSFYFLYVLKIPKPLIKQSNKMQLRGW